MCIFTLKSVIKYYTQQSTPVYSCFLDASKAFDRVNHWKLFNKFLFLVRNVPLLIVRMFCFYIANRKCAFSGPNLHVHLAFSLFQMTSNNSSCILDPMPTKLLKQYVDEVLPMITAIVNKSLTHEHFPSDLKHALIKLHLQKPSLDTNELNHYRPVSNLHFLSKIIEKIVVSRLEEHTYAHNSRPSSASLQSKTRNRDCNYKAHAKYIYIYIYICGVTTMRTQSPM